MLRDVFEYIFDSKSQHWWFINGSQVCLPLSLIDLHINWQKDLVLVSNRSYVKRQFIGLVSLDVDYLAPWFHRYQIVPI